MTTITTNLPTVRTVRTNHKLLCQVPFCPDLQTEGLIPMVDSCHQPQILAHNLLEYRCVIHLSTASVSLGVGPTRLLKAYQEEGNFKHELLQIVIVLVSFLKLETVGVLPHLISD